MAINIKTVRLQAPATNTTQSYTVGSFGTAQAIIVTAATASTDGTDADDIRSSFGFWDTTNTACWSTHYESGVANASALNRSEQSSTNVCEMATGGVGTEREAAASATTDGIILTWTGADTTIRPYVTVTLINGINGAQVGGHTPSALSGDVTGDATETTTGITPKVIFGGMNRRNIGDGGASWATTCFGMAYDNGVSIDQRAIAWQLVGGSASAFASQSASTDRIALNMGNEVIDTELLIKSMNSGNFVTTNIDGSGGGSEESDLYYLALDFDEDAAVFSSQVTTSAGDWTPLTGESFTPGAVIMLPTFSATVNDIEKTNEAGFWGWYIADGTNEYGYGWNYEDGAATNIDSSGRVDQAIWNSDKTAGTADFEASSPTFSSGAITYADANVTHSVAAKASYVFGIAFEEAAGSSSIPVLHHARTLYRTI